MGIDATNLQRKKKTWKLPGRLLFQRFYLLLNQSPAPLKIEKWVNSEPFNVSKKQDIGPLNI